MYSSIRNYPSMHNTDGKPDTLFAIRMREKYGINTYYDNADIEAANMEILDVVEGCLCDNLLCEDEDGNVIIFAEKTLNNWSSALVPIIGKDNNDTWDIWYSEYQKEDDE